MAVTRTSGRGCCVVCGNEATHEIVVQIGSSPEHVFPVCKEHGEGVEQIEVELHERPE